MNNFLNGWLPAQHFSNVCRESMVGDHLIPIVADAFVKGYRDFDVEFVYEAIKKKALENTTESQTDM